MDEKYLFILSPPFSGSSLLHNIVASSDHVSTLPTEGQHIDGVRKWTRGPHWDPDHQVPWSKVRKVWERHWEPNRPIKLEKSPPNLLRAPALEREFRQSYFIIMIGNPYAFCEGCYRRVDRYDLVDCANLWVRCARHQIRNRKQLQHTLFTTYERLTTNTESEIGRIQEFLPALSDIDLSSPGTFSLLGGGQNRIWNINRLKTLKLRKTQVGTINSVLNKERTILQSLGYTILKPNRRRFLDRARIMPFIFLSRLARKLNEMGVLRQSVPQRLENRIIRLTEDLSYSSADQ